MAIVGVGSGALVAALPASAAAGAPAERTGFATGMTNATKTMGGAIASAIFAIALSSTGSIQDPVKGQAPLHGLPGGLVGLRSRGSPRGPRSAAHAACRGARRPVRGRMRKWRHG